MSKKKIDLAGRFLSACMSQAFVRTVTDAGYSSRGCTLVWVVTVLEDHRYAHTDPSYHLMHVRMSLTSPGRQGRNVILKREAPPTFKARADIHLNPAELREQCERLISSLDILPWDPILTQRNGRIPPFMSQVGSKIASVPSTSDILDLSLMMGYLRQRVIGWDSPEATVSRHCYRLLDEFIRARR